MAHFAKLNETNEVMAVLCVDNSAIDSKNEEQSGIEFLTNLYGHTLWKQTSYNGNFRKNYAGIGYIYDEERDAFIAPQPFPSWILDEELCDWKAPKPRPNEGFYFWDEDKGEWVNAETV